jgi:hypothetical protein
MSTVRCLCLPLLKNPLIVSDTTDHRRSGIETPVGFSIGLESCSHHERLYVVAQERWIGFAEEEVNVIEYLYELLCLPELQVVEAMCDHCQQFGGKILPKQLKAFHVIN